METNIELCGKCGTKLFGLYCTKCGWSTPNISDITFKQLETEVKEWAQRNFPDAKPHQPLLGAQEEIGELSHAHLKQEQGIRGTPEQHKMDKMDAVGDAIIFLAHYSGLNGFSLSDAVTCTWGKVKQRDWQKNKANGGSHE
jgi:NTP pyrophosphatase (non-canonical NTP hydrolase)